MFHQRKRGYLPCWLAVFVCCSCLAASPVEDLATGFTRPAHGTGAWVYWWWLNGYVSREGIVRELDSMKQQGIAGAAIFHGGKTFTPGHTPFMSDEWRSNFRYAVQEASKRGIQVSLNICEGWNAGGPWIDEEHASQWLQHASMRIRGPARIAQALPAFATDGRKHNSKGLFVFAWNIKDGVCASQSFLDLGGNVDDQGSIKWDAPEGEWIIVRFGRFILQGRGYIKYSNHPDYEKQYFEANEMNAEAVRIHFEHTARVIIEDVRPYAGKTFTHIFTDSSETAQPDWTPGFFDEFKKLRGYDPRPYLAAKANLAVDSSEVTAWFLEDYRRTQGDLTARGYYGEFTRLAALYGLGTHSQAAGHQKPMVDALQALGANTIPMGEFWARVPDWKWIHQAAQVQLAYHDSIRSAASAAHVYGRPIVCAEAFSAPYSRQPYSMALYDLKDTGDRAFCQGLNRMVLCYLAHQPECERAMPGYVGFPHVFSVNDTWWWWSKAWFDYLNRSQFLLQKGRPVADVCYFQGEWVPSYVQAKWGMDPSLPRGYDCDVVNAEVLTGQARAGEEGHLVLNGGTSYRYLVLSQAGYRGPAEGHVTLKAKDLPPAIREWPDVASGKPLALSQTVLRRIKQLVEDGVTLVGMPPDRAFGLSGFPASDQEIKSMAESVWGSNPGASGSRRLGKGRIIWGAKLREVMAADGLLPDVEYAEDAATSALPLPVDTEALLPDPSGFDWIHRREGEADFYFVVNYRNAPAGAVFTFRQTGRQPELWDPLTGAIRDLPEWTTTPDKRIALPLKFAPRQSWFVVFRRQFTGSRLEKVNFPETVARQNLDGPWSVSFDPKRGGPLEAVELASLVDWSLSEDNRVKFYSGIARYSKTFRFDPGQRRGAERVFIDLGRVEIMARVHLNGKDCGTIWTAPWQVDVTGALADGENKLEIEVANLWRNRLLGDATKPPGERVTTINVQMKPNEPLAPSGLMGPVVILKSVSK